MTLIGPLYFVWIDWAAIFNAIAKALIVVLEIIAMPFDLIFCGCFGFEGNAYQTSKSIDQWTADFIGIQLMDW